MEDYSIELDEYREEIRVMGCVQKNGKWVTYATDFRDGHAYIIDSYATEDEAFSDFYLLIKSQIKAETLYGPPKRD